MVSSVLDDEDRFRIMIQQAIDAGEVESYRAFTKESAKSKKARRDLAESEKKEAEEYAKELGVWDVLFGEKKKRKEEQEAAEAVGDVEMHEAQDEEDEDEETAENTSGKGKGRTAKKAEPAGRPNTRVEKKTKAKKEDDTSALENLIKNRQADRQAGFLASLEAKYGVDGSEVKKEKKGRKTGRGRKAVDEDLDGDAAEPTEEEFQAAKKKLESRGGKKRSGENGKAENSTGERRSKRNKP
jgi:DnaJ family protein C protein 9